MIAVRRGIWGYKIAIIGNSATTKIWEFARSQSTETTRASLKISAFFQQLEGLSGVGIGRCSSYFLCGSALAFLVRFALSIIFFDFGVWGRAPCLLPAAQHTPCHAAYRNQRARFCLQLLPGQTLQRRSEKARAGSRSRNAALGQTGLQTVVLKDNGCCAPALPLFLCK